MFGLTSLVSYVSAAVIYTYVWSKKRSPLKNAFFKDSKLDLMHTKQYINKGAYDWFWSYDFDITFFKY